MAASDASSAACGVGSAPAAPYSPALERPAAQHYTAQHEIQGGAHRPQPAQGAAPQAAATRAASAQAAAPKAAPLCEISFLLPSPIPAPYPSPLPYPHRRIGIMLSRCTPLQNRVLRCPRNRHPPTDRHAGPLLGSRSGRGDQGPRPAGQAPHESPGLRLPYREEGQSYSSQWRWSTPARCGPAGRRTSHCRA